MSGSTIFLDSDGDIDPSIANGFFPPVSNGIVWYAEHLGSLARAATNLVNPSASGTVVGAPVLGADGVLCTGNAHYIQTPIPETDDITEIHVGAVVTTVSAAAAGRTMLMGNLTATPNTRGAAIFVQEQTMGGPAAPPAAALVGGTRYASGPVTAYLNQADPTGAWRCRAFRIGGTTRKLNDLTLGTSITNTTASTRDLNAANQIAIGSGFNPANYSGQSKALISVIYNRSLADEELAAMYTFLKAQAASLNASIVV